MSNAKNIRDLLPYGAIKRVSEKTNSPYWLVNAVIDNKATNETVLKALKAEISAAQKQAQRIDKLRASIINQ